MGQKENPQNRAPTNKNNDSTAEQSVQLGDMFSTRHQDSLYNPSVTDRGSPRVTRPDY